jgi:hypothetical protein
MHLFYVIHALIYHDMYVLAFICMYLAGIQTISVCFRIYSHGIYIQICTNISEYILNTNRYDLFYLIPFDLYSIAIY